MKPRVGLTLVAVAAAAWLLGSASVVEAHATLVESSPASGAVLDSPPGEVAIDFGGKLITAEGDPVQVFSAAGERVDDGDPRVTVVSFGRSESTLTVRLSPGLESGTYQVMYRVISVDTHLVTGSFSFHLQSGGQGAGAPRTARAPAGAPPSPGMSGSIGLLPVLMLPVAGVLALGSFVVGWAQRRWERGDRD